MDPWSESNRPDAPAPETSLPAEPSRASDVTADLPTETEPHLEPPLAAVHAEPRRRSGPHRLRRVAVASVAALGLLAGGYSIRAATEPTAVQAATAAGASATVATSSSASAHAGDDVVALVRAAEPAVVKVTSQIQSQAGFFQPGSSGQAVGTGFSVSADGLIVTNDHVVKNASSITVTLNDGRELPAQVLVEDQQGDLAILKVQASGLATLALAASTPQAGASVVAIGYALALGGSPSVTTGVISSTDRTIQVQDQNAGIFRTYRHLLQTSAAINEGNSGGPLLNAQGQVVGVTTAGAQSAENLGFAIPASQVRALLASATA